MTESNTKEIFSKLTEIAISVARQEEKQTSANCRLKSIDKHLETQNSSIAKHNRKLSAHSVWIKILSAVVVAVLIGAITSVF